MLTESLRLQGWFYRRELCMLLMVGLLFAGTGAASASPTVTAITPADGATEVQVDTAISATFSEPMEAATVTPGSVTLSQPVRIRAVAAGYNYTLALKENGTVMGWGYNGNGQNNVPAGLGNVTAIAAGSNHGLALKSDGTVVAWGENTRGQSTVPAGLVETIAVAAGGNFTLALRADNTVVAWGDNSHGQTTIPGGLAGVSAIAAGNFHALALKADGTVVAWGFNSSGQTNVPSGLSGVRAVAAGVNHSVALKADGTVVAWGANDKGQSSVPAGLSGVVAISTTLDSNLALKNDGTVVAWGDNSCGQADIPAGVTGIAAIAAGHYHNVALKGDGTVVSWGDNSNSQTTLPARLSGVTAVAAGGSHTVALKSDGTLFAWGDNGSGQAAIPAGLTGVSAIAAGFAHTLSLGSSGTVVAWGRNYAGQTTVPADLGGVTAVAAGDYHSVALKNDGTVVAWGMNSEGQATVPTGLTGVMKIAAGAAHTVALKQDGTVTAWGGNSYNAATVPIGLDQVVDIAAGGYHSVALKSDGNLVAWGDNREGQSTVPADLADVIAIAAGNSHTVALKSDGTVVAWGANDLGQSSVPDGLDRVVGIAAGSGYTVAVKNDGTLAGWGDNKIGQAASPQDPYAQSVAIAVSYSTGNDTVTITPAAALPLATTLTATVNTGVRSLGGNHPAADYSWSFTTIDPVPPVTTASPSGGTYSSPQSVTLAANEPATIYYTTNGATPTIASPVYSGPIPVSVSTTLKFFALDTAGNSEAVRTATYFINLDTTPPVTTASPGGGAYSSPQSVTLAANEPATIYYTTNGATPTIASPVYSGPIPVSVSTTLKFFARDTAGNSEAVKTAIYTLTLDTTPPVTTASPPGGTYSSPQSVTLAANEPATIYYTTNGATPTTSSPVYSGSIPVSVSTTLKFFARDTAGNSEVVRTAIYSINLDTTPPVTTASPVGGTYGSAQSVTLTANEPATIYYTTNGATPTTASPSYSGPIPIPATTTLKFFARDTAGNSETVRTESYTIKQNQTITFAPLPAKTYGDPAFSLSAIASSGLPVSYTSSNTSVATVSGTTVTIVGAGSAVITASQGGNAVYNPATAVARTLTVNKAALTVRAADATRPYGVENPAFSATYSGFVNGDTQASLSGSPALSTAAIATSPVGTYPIVAAAGTLASPNYGFTFVNGVLTVAKATATVILGGLSTTYDGTQKAATATTVPAGLAVILTYDGGPAAPVAAGSYSVVATVSDSNYAGSASGTLIIARASQTITFALLPAKTYGDPAFTLSATAGSALPVSYTSSNPAVATVSGQAVTIVGAGTAIITASQGGDNNYNPATDVSQSLTINKAPATVTLGSLGTVYDGSPKTATATTVPAGLAVVLAYDGSETAPTAAGSYAVVGSVSDPNYEGSASGTLTIAKGDQTITFGPLPVKTYGDPAFTLAATAGSGLAVTYGSSNTAVATVSGSTVTIVGAGTATITASQNGNSNYNAAPAVTQTLTVNKAMATITFGQLTFTYDGNPKPVTVTTLPAGLAVTITYDGSATPPVEVGKYAVVATVNDPNYQGTATATEEISKRSQTITFGPLPVKTYGDAPFTFTADASSNLNVVFEYDPTIVAITKQGQKYLATIVGAGTTVITATQPGNRNYSEAPPVSQTLIVNKAAATVTLSGLSATYDGSAKAATATTSPAGLAVAVTYNGSATPPTAAGSYGVVGTITNANYQGSASGTLVIAKAGQVITFDSLAARTYGSAPFSPGATASSGLAVSYTSSNPAVATVSGSSVTIVGIGTTTITASQTGDDNYTSAAGVPQTLTVTKGTATVTLGGLTTVYTGTPRAATATTVPGGLPVTLTYNGLATAPTAAGSYTVAATVNSPNYQGSATGTLTIAKGAQTISFGPLAAKTVGNAPFALSATATSGLTISYTSSNPAVATVSGTTVTIVGAGTAVITASQGGNGNYEAASPVNQTLTVNAAPVTTGNTAVTIGTVTSYYDTLTAALATIPAGATTIRLQTMTFAEAVNLNVSGATVSMFGGYDSGFSSATGMTTIQGGLVITRGALVADRLVIR